MKIAVQNSWPNLKFSAEREFIARVRLAGASLGWSVAEVVTSDDILALAPDVVLVTHEFTAKLTHYPTIGVIWSPTSFFSEERDRIRNILSYDGYLVATDSLRTYLRNLLVSHGKNAPISEFDFLPSAISNLPVAEKSTTRSLFYAGVHWDGSRHGDLFAALRGRIPLRIHGDPSQWQGFDEFAGPLAFDGRSVVGAIQECGIALSLHRIEHRTEGIPSMRLFEAAAAGAVVISDRIEFARQAFGDAVLYVDADADASTVSRQIVEHVNWIRENPMAADALAKRCHQIFERRFSLPVILGKIPAFVDEVRQAMQVSYKEELEPVEIIIRVGSRPLAIVARAIASVAAQRYKRIGLIIVSFRAVKGLEDLLETYKDRFETTKVINVPDNGVRSTALWAGLKAASSPFITNLDDDDVIHPDHFSSLVQSLKQRKTRTPLAYSGTIQVQEEDGHWFDQINFRGDGGRIVQERRRLRFLEAFDRKALLQFENYIQSNAWMIRRSDLSPEMLEDPELIVAEDIYLYLIVMQKGDFVPSWRPTAEWNWRSNARDNVMFSPELWGVVWETLLKRLSKAGVISNLDPTLDSCALVGLTSDNDVTKKPENIWWRPDFLLLLRGGLLLLAQPSRLLPRLRYATAMVRSGGTRSLLMFLRRHGRR